MVSLKFGVRNSEVWSSDGHALLVHNLQAYNMGGFRRFGWAGARVWMGKWVQDREAEGVEWDGEWGRALPHRLGGLGNVVSIPQPKTNFSAFQASQNTSRLDVVSQIDVLSEDVC